MPRDIQLFDGKSIDIQKAIDDGIVPPFPTLTMGALGCSMSHFYIYKEIMRGNCRSYGLVSYYGRYVKFHPIMMLRSQVLQSILGYTTINRRICQI